MTDRRARRAVLPAVLGVLAFGVSGCASVGPPVQDVDGLPCVAFRKAHRSQRICAARPAPPAEEAREAVRFVPEPAAGQVVVHWLHRAGATWPLALWLDGRPVSDLLPGGIVRLRVAPGAHVLTVAWQGQQAPLSLQVDAATVRFLEVDGWSRLWQIGYQWQPVDAAGARERAGAARLIADIDARAPGVAAGVSVPPMR